MVKKCLYIFILIFLKSDTVLSAKSSLVFVIDDSGSMGDDIKQVQEQASKLTDAILKEKKSRIDEFVLVTYNDPIVKPTQKTKDVETLKIYLNSIYALSHVGGDCPEMTIAGIERGLQDSLPGSYVYVFTDASAKDYYNYKKVINLCQKKQSQVVFVLTGYCLGSDREDFKVYHKIATACAGQVFLVNKPDVNKIIILLTETVKGDGAVITTQLVPPSWRTTVIPFVVDNTTEYVLISVSGIVVHLELLEYTKYDILIWLEDVKAIKLIKPLPGTYHALVGGKTYTSVKIFGRTDFTFQHGFSELMPKSLNDTTAKPIAGTESYLSVLVNDPDNSIDVHTAQILSMSEKVIKTTPLRCIEGNYYVTDLLLTPDYMFKVAVLGTHKGTNQDIRRIASTPVEPQKPVFKPKEVSPELTISEGTSINVPYGGNITVTCKVTAYPKPHITWLNENRVIQVSKSSILELPYDFVSYLTISNVKDGHKYFCSAKNIHGWSEKAIFVNVLSPFEVKSHPEDVTYAEYGKDVTLTCDIKSNLPINIFWFRKVNNLGTFEQIKQTNKYSISKDGIQLKINEIDINTSGDYACRAMLQENRDIDVTYNTDVKLVGLEKPVIDKNGQEIINVKEGLPVTLSCDVIKGNPKPEIKWWYKRLNSNIFSETGTNGKKLVIPNTLLTQSGNYKCIATNFNGDDERIIKLVVNKSPEVSIDGGNEQQIEYGGTLEIVCRVTAFPKPIVLWRNSRGETVRTKVKSTEYGQYRSVLKISKTTRSETYSCEVSNDIGEAVQKVSIHVGSPFTIGSVPEGVTNVEYGKEVILNCDITSSLPMKITWLRVDRPLKTQVVIDSDVYYISNDGKKLKIKFVDLDVTGKFMCKASLLDDVNENVNFTTVLNAQGLESPKIDKSGVSVINKRENEPVTLICNVIKGNPPPSISWLFKGLNSNRYMRLKMSDKMLTFPRTEFMQTGEYKCIATNALGEDSKMTQLLVHTHPDVTIVGERDRIVDYNSKLTLTCKVRAYPSPKILWRDSNGKVLLGEEMHTEGHGMFSSSLQINVIKSDKYYCEASNELGASNKDFIVSIKSPFDVSSFPQPNINVEYGKEHTVKCDVTSSYPMRIMWYLNGTELKLETVHKRNVYSISNEGRYLKLNTMDLDMVGGYTCKAFLLENEDIQVSFTTNVDIYGLEIPKIERNNEVKVKENESAIISCKILKGTPKPKITWQFKIKESDVFKNIANVFDEQLIIPKTANENVGKYRCIATNVAGKDENEVELIIEAPPKITADKTAYEGLEGDIILRIPCNVSGSPKPNVSWKIEATGKILKTDTLEINSPLEKDSGSYTCIANNYLGTANMTFTASIRPYLDLDEDYGNAQEVYIEEGKPKSIPCHISKSKSDSIRWYKDGVLKATKGPYYSWVKPDYYDQANYTCRVSNNIESKSFTYTVLVGLPPEFLNEDDTKINWRGDSVMNCGVTSKPNLHDAFISQFTWLHNNITIKNATSPFLSVSDWGKYTCRASNALGLIERTFEVESTGCLINRNSKIIINPPIILINSTNNIINEYISLDKRESIELVCPDSSFDKNFFQIVPSRHSLTVLCDHQDEFSVDGKIVKYSEFKCNKKVMPDAKDTNKTCLNGNGKVVSVGFNTEAFTNLYEVCLDKNLNVPLYTKIITSEGSKNVDTYENDWFTHTAFDYVKKETIYNCTDDKGCCYTKGQLVNVQDIGFQPDQTATFIDNINAIPIWVPCNSRNSNWNIMENKIRESIETGDVILSGAAHYKFTNGGIAPRYLWKILYRPGYDVTVLVGVNGPDPNESDILCKDSCSGAFPSKYIYCCSLAELAKAFDVDDRVKEIDSME